MDENIDFKEIWNQQKTEQPNLNEMMVILKKFKKSSLRKLIIANILLFCTIALILFIWIYFKPKFISTKIGIILTILGIIIYAFSFNKLSKNLKQIDNNQDNSKFLNNLEILLKKQKFVQTKMLTFYFITLSLGVCLYMYEYTITLSLFWKYFTYISFFIWIAFNWFYIRPKTIKKQELKLNNLIVKYQNLSNQFVKN